MNTKLIKLIITAAVTLSIVAAVVFAAIHNAPSKDEGTKDALVITLILGLMILLNSRLKITIKHKYPKDKTK